MVRLVLRALFFHLSIRSQQHLGDEIEFARKSSNSMLGVEGGGSSALWRCGVDAMVASWDLHDYAATRLGYAGEQGTGGADPSKTPHGRGGAEELRSSNGWIFGEYG